MMKRDEWKRHINEYSREFIIFGLLLLFAFLINWGIEMKGLYMDDLYLWSCFGEQSFFEYVFPIGSTRFRFIYNLASYLQLGMIGNKINLIVPFNILLNTVVAYGVYRFGKRLSGGRFLGGICGVMYLLSRMSYYQIGQLYGLMETMALAMAIGILYLLYRYCNEDRKEHFFVVACVLYVAVCFVHERYLVLFPLLLLSFCLQKKRRWLLLGISIASFFMVLVIRLFAIGTLSPAGTGGTDVADTFSLTSVCSYALSQVAYVFGINAGPEHLNGMSFTDSPPLIQILVVGSIVTLVILVAMFVIRLVKEKQGRSRHLQNSLLFLTFLALCIASSSVTIRVEMRWVYVSYTAALLWLAYIYGALNTSRERKVYVLPATILCVLYVGSMLCVEVFYRGQFSNIYLWPNQLRYNSLAEETYGRYGEELFGKKIYIVKNTYEMSDFTARTFFKTFDKERSAEGTEVIFVDRISDVGQVRPDMIVLGEDVKHHAFVDITEVVKEMMCDVAYGYYDDGWMDEKASLRIMTGATGEIQMDFSYPGQLKEEQKSEIYLNGELVKTVTFDENQVSVVLKAEPYQVVDLGFVQNFYLEDAKEQRGENRLSMLVSFTTP